MVQGSRIEGFAIRFMVVVWYLLFCFLWSLFICYLSMLGTSWFLVVLFVDRGMFWGVQAFAHTICSGRRAGSCMVQGILEANKLI